MMNKTEIAHLVILRQISLILWNILNNSEMNLKSQLSSYSAKVTKYNMLNYTFAFVIPALIKSIKIK